MYNIIFTHSVLDLTSEYISSVSRKKLTWNLQVTDSAVTVKLIGSRLRNPLPQL